MDMTKTNLIYVVHLLCLVHLVPVLHILSIVDTCLHVMDGDLITMVGFAVAANMAVVAGARLVGAIAAPEVVDVGADAPKVVPA